jgi:FkbM family methyltransferase
MAYDNLKRGELPSDPINGREIAEFKLDSLKLSFPKQYQMILREVYIFDVYRSDLLREGDMVLDLGATIGEFSVLASKKVGDTGMIVSIEPNMYDYNLLELNIRQNNCRNIVPINMGVGNELGVREMSFHGKAFNCTLDTLENILEVRGIKREFSFVKVDIEGYEVELLKKSIDTLSQANVISIELHGSKKKVDDILIPHGFTFYPVTTSYCVTKMIKNVGLHPRHLLSTIRNMLQYNPRLAYKLLAGYNMQNNKLDLIMGSYIKER